MSTDSDYVLHIGIIEAVDSPIDGYCKVRVPSLNNNVFDVPPDGLTKYLSAYLLPEVGDRKMLAIAQNKAHWT